MPQKKNPDVLELIRGRTARVIGALTTLLVLVKGLPLAYNRDLQEDKEPLFDAFDTVEACLELAAVVVDGAQLRADRIAERLDEGYPRRHHPDGIPDRRGRPPAHRARGHRPPGRPLRAPRLPPPGRPARRRASPRPIPSLGPGVKDVLGVANAVKAFRSYGSTAPAEVEKQLAALERPARKSMHERPSIGDRTCQHRLAASGTIRVGDARPPSPRFCVNESVHLMHPTPKRPMDHFHYRDGQLYCEDIPVAELAEKYGTPLYVYSQAAFLGTLEDAADGVRRGRPAGLLLGQGELEPGHPQGDGRARQRVRRGLRRASCTGCRPAGGRAGQDGVRRGGQDRRGDRRPGWRPAS